MYLRNLVEFICLITKTIFILYLLFYYQLYAEKSGVVLGILISHSYQIILKRNLLSL